MKRTPSKLKNIKRELEKLFSENKSKAFNYKQLASKLELDSSEGKDAIIRNLKIMEKEGAVEVKDKVFEAGE
jgi:ribonuclease R